MGTPAECRRHAVECLELARTASNSAHRDLLLGLAAQWCQLAGAKQQDTDVITNDPDRGN
jgi:hypothetical protein